MESNLNQSESQALLTRIERGGEWLFTDDDYRPYQTDAVTRLRTIAGGLSHIHGRYAGDPELAHQVVADIAWMRPVRAADARAIEAEFDAMLHRAICDLTRDQAAALSEVTVEDFKDGRGENARDVRRIKIKMADKRAALVDVGRHLGMFADHIELTGPNGGPIQVQQITSRVIDADYTDITDAVSESVSESIEAPVGDEAERRAGADNAPRLPSAVTIREV